MYEKRTIKVKGEFNKKPKQRKSFGNENDLKPTLEMTTVPGEKKW